MTAFDDFARLLLVTVPELILLGFGGFLLALALIKPLGLASQAGTVMRFDTEFQPGMNIGCGQAHFMTGSAVSLQVELETGSMILAQTSPCTICLDKLKPGDSVRVIKVGDRYIALKVAFWRFGKC